MRKHMLILRMYWGQVSVRLAAGRQWRGVSVSEFNKARVGVCTT